MTENSGNIKTTVVNSKGKSNKMKVAKAILSTSKVGYYQKFQKTDVRLRGHLKKLQQS